MSLEGFRAFIGEQLISQPSGRHEIVTTNLYCFCGKVRFGAKRTFWRIVHFGAGVCLGAESTITGLLKGAILLICNGLTVPNCRSGRTEGGRKRTYRAYENVSRNCWIVGAGRRSRGAAGLVPMEWPPFPSPCPRRKAADAQRHRALSCGSVMSVRHGQSLTPG